MFEHMSKSSLINNPNMMIFSGDNLTVPINMPNPIFHPETNSMTTQLGNNLDLNISVPPSEKFNNLGFMNTLPNSSPGFNNPSLVNIGISNLSNQNFAMNNLQSIDPNPKLNVLQPNMQSIGNKKLIKIGLPPENIRVNVNGGLNPNLSLSSNTLSPSLNASLLPTPIPLEVNHPVSKIVEIPHPALGNML